MKISELNLNKKPEQDETVNESPNGMRAAQYAYDNMSPPEDEETFVDCSHCHGLGQIKGQTCEMCSGEGVVYLDDDSLDSEDYFGDIDEAAAPPMDQVYPDTKQGVLQYLQSAYDKSFLKQLDLPTCRIHPDPQVEGVWAVDSKNSGYRCIIYLAGYNDPWGQKRKTNDNEEGGMSYGAMKAMVQDGELTPALMKQWAKFGSLDPDDMSKLMKMYNEWHGVEESVTETEEVVEGDPDIPLDQHLAMKARERNRWLSQAARNPSKPAPAPREQGSQIKTESFVTEMALAKIPHPMGGTLELHDNYGDRTIIHTPADGGRQRVLFHGDAATAAKHWAKLKSMSGVTESVNIFKKLELEINSIFLNEDKDPESDEEFDELAKVLSEPLTAGPDGANAISAISELLSNEELADMIYDIAKENPDADVAKNIRDWIEQSKPELYHSLFPNGDPSEKKAEAPAPKKVDTAEAADLKRLAGIKSLTESPFDTEPVAELESTVDDKVAGAVINAVRKLIGQGHTDVDPTVITNMVVAATGKPFLLKDLVAVNKRSQEVQHYIDSINPTKIKFSSDILTVKNGDANKEQDKKDATVAAMASRAAKM